MKFEYENWLGVLEGFRLWVVVRCCRGGENSGSNGNSFKMSAVNIIVIHVID